MSFYCRQRGNAPCIDDVCRSMNDCAWEPDDLSRSAVSGSLPESQASRIGPESARHAAMEGDGGA
jgi:hypothetical protein